MLGDVNYSMRRNNSGFVSRHEQHALSDSDPAGFFVGGLSVITMLRQDIGRIFD